MKELDKVLQQYVTFKDFEDETDKVEKLTKLMATADNFAVANPDNKKQLQHISFGKSSSRKTDRTTRYRANNNNQSIDKHSQT